MAEHDKFGTPFCASLKSSDDVLRAEQEAAEIRKLFEEAVDAALKNTGPAIVQVGGIFAASGGAVWLLYELIQRGVIPVQ